MSGAIPPLSHTPSWPEQGKKYMFTLARRFDTHGTISERLFLSPVPNIQAGRPSLISCLRLLGCHLVSHAVSSPRSKHIQTVRLSPWI
jgi:hypothetical protein